MIKLSETNICLNYHNFSGTISKEPLSAKYSIDFGKFKEHLEILSNYKNIALNNLLLNNIHSFSYSLTFDDGFKSCLYIAEELAKRNIKGTFFIIKNKSLFNSGYLNMDEIKELDKMGMEIGSHSCSHRHMNRLPVAELVKELRESKSFLEDILSKPVLSIAFPGGQCGSREIELALQEGYLLNRTCIQSINHLPLEKGIVKSISITTKINLESYKKILNLSPSFFATSKIRELTLIFPKFIASSLLARKHKYNEI